MNAAEAKHTSSETEIKAIEGAVHAVVRINMAANTVTNGQDALAAGAASVADIEKLMAELLVARDLSKRGRRAGASRQCQLSSLGANCFGLRASDRREPR